MKKYLIIFLVFVYLIINEVLPRISALSYQAKNVTLVLEGCENEECHLQGVWKKDPVTLNHILVLDNGSQVMFKMENIKMLSVPIQSVN